MTVTPISSRAQGETVAIDVSGLSAGYGGRPVVFDVSFGIEREQLTLMLGHNGAGKTTALKAIAGLARVIDGRISVSGQDLRGMSARERLRRGLIYLPQERATFGELSVQDNLALAASMARDATTRADRQSMVAELFPRLAERSGQRASTMSGGEQRMLAVGMTLMAGADVLLLDEPSLGMAPALVESMLEAIQALVREHGLTVLLVEQNLAQSLLVADRVLVMRSGVIQWSASGDDARAREDWSALF